MCNQRISDFFRVHLPFHVGNKGCELLTDGNQEYHSPSTLITREYSTHWYQQQVNVPLQNHFKSQGQLALSRAYYFYSANRSCSFPHLLQLGMKQHWYVLCWVGWVKNTKFLDVCCSNAQSQKHGSWEWISSRNKQPAFFRVSQHPAKGVSSLLFDKDYNGMTGNFGWNIQSTTACLGFNCQMYKFRADHFHPLHTRHRQENETRSDQQDGCPAGRASETQLRYEQDTWSTSYGMQRGSWHSPVPASQCLGRNYQDRINSVVLTTS